MIQRLLKALRRPERVFKIDYGVYAAGAAWEALGSVEVWFKVFRVF
jgi:hypothetical protein